MLASLQLQPTLIFGGHSCWYHWPLHTRRAHSPLLLLPACLSLPPPQITEDERAEVLEHVQNATTWFNDLTEQQDGKEPHEEPVLTRSVVKGYLHRIKMRVRLLSKRRPLPSPSPSPAATSAADEEQEPAAGDSESAGRQEASESAEAEAELGSEASELAEEEAEL